MQKETNDMNTISINTVQRMIDYIEENIFETITPNSVADHFYISLSTLNSLFKVVCNMTIMEYVRNRRLSLAGQELLNSNISIIDLALKYGYETPEAFTKAFTRLQGFPPSFVRRVYPELKMFHPLSIKLEIHGGWKDNTDLSILTKSNSSEQEHKLFNCYDKATKYKGGLPMEKVQYNYQISVQDMKQKEDWRILLLLAQHLDEYQIDFKFDGNTMIFAHGLEFKLDKICVTFKWNEEQRVKDFFHYEGNAISSFQGFKFFDSIFEGMKIRCMFYGDSSDDSSNDLFYRHAEAVNVDGQIIYVQTLDFYIENSEPSNEHYKRVEQWLKNRSL